MIQRIQTIWLLGVAALATISIVEKIHLDVFFTSFIIANGLIAITSIITVFLYKKRLLQTKMCYGILILLIIAVSILFYNNVCGKILFLTIAIIMDIFAIRSIKKDEKLVRSLDKLR